MFDRREAEADRPQEKLVAILQAAFDFFEAHPYMSDLLQRVEALNPSDETFAWTPVRKEFARRIETILADESLGIADPASTALMLLGALRESIASANARWRRESSSKLSRRFCTGRQSSGRAAAKPAVPSLTLRVGVRRSP